MVSSFTHSPISGRLRTTSIRLPIHIEAMMPQNSAGCSVATFGPGHDALDDHRADHQRHHRIGRDAERQHRDERGLGRRHCWPIPAPPRPRSRPCRTRSGVLRDALFDGIGGEGSEDRAAAGQDAEHRADRRAAQDRCRIRRSPRRVGIRPVTFLDQHGAVMLVFQIAQDFGDAEYARPRRQRS